MRKNIMKFRKMRRLSPEQIDARIGKKPAFTAKIETGQIKNPTIKGISMITNVLEVSLGEIFSDEPPVIKRMRLSIQHFREKRGLTPTQLDQKIGAKCIYTQRVEEGRINPSADRILEIAQALGVTWKDIFA